MNLPIIIPVGGENTVVLAAHNVGLIVTVT